MFIKAGSIGLLIVVFCSTLACFTNTLNPTQAIYASMQTGEAHYLASYFDTDLALRIDPTGVDFSSVSANQAELMMHSFFKRYPPLRFQAVEQGNTAHLRYAMGNYWSGTRTFHINVLMRQTSPGYYRINSIQVNE